jgi:hypothetical protein
MYNFFKKKSNPNCLLLNHYEILFRSKHKTKNLTADADISFPVFLKGIMSFLISGKIIRKRKKNTHLNQTITVESFLSKNVVRIMVQTQFPLLKTR